jgi:MFS family permease
LSQTRRRFSVALYLAIAFLFWVSLFLYVPTLSTYVQSKASNLAVVGVILSMYGLWQGLVRIPLGIISDRLGWRKPFIMAGLALAGGGAWLMGHAESATELLVGRSLTGLAAGAWVPLIVVFSSLFPLEEAIRATTWLTLANSMGRVLATGLTGTLNSWQGPSFTFIIAAAIAGLAVVLLWPAYEPRHPVPPLSGRRIGQLFLRRDVLLASLLAALLQYVNWSTTLSFNPILAQQLGGSDISQSLLVSMNIGVAVIGNLLAVMTLRYVEVRRLVFAGFGIISLGVGLAALAPSLRLLFVAQFFLGLGEGVIYPLLMGLSIKNVAQPERNTAMGLHQATYAVGTFLGPWLSGQIAQGIGLRLTYGIMACIVLGLSWLLASHLPKD